MTARVELPGRPAGAEFPPLHQVARWSRRAQRSRALFPLRQRLSDLYILLFGAAVFAAMGYQILTGASAGARAGAGLGSAGGPGLSLRVDFLPLPLAAAGSLALLAACLGAIGRLGPIFLRPEEALWWLQLPGARQRFLHRRLLFIAGVGTACFGAFGAALAALLTASAASHVLLAAGAGALPGAAGGWLVFAAVASAQVGSNAREGAPAGAGRYTIHSAGRGTEWGAERCATRPRTARTALLLLAALNALHALSPSWVPALPVGGMGTSGAAWAAPLPLALVLAQATLLAALALSWWRGQVVAGLEEVPDVSLQESSRRALGLLASGVSLDVQALGRLLSPPNRMPHTSSRLALARLGRALPTPLRVALAVLQGDALVFARQPWRLLQLGGGIALATAVGLVRSPFAAAALLLVSGTLTALAAGAAARAAAFRSGAEQHWPAPALLVGAAHLQLPFLLGLPWALAVSAALAWGRAQLSLHTGAGIAAYALLLSLGWAAVAVRSAFRPAPTWHLFIATEMGPLPVGLLRSIATGPDAAFIASFPTTMLLLAAPSAAWTLGAALVCTGLPLLMALSQFKTSPSSS